MAGERWAPVGGAQAVVHSQVPDVWDASFVSRVPPSASPGLLLDEARRHFVRHGCAHVKILIDDPDAVTVVGSGLCRRGMLKRAYATLQTRKIPMEQPAQGRIRIEPVSSKGDRRLLARVRDQVRRQAPWYTKEVSEALDAWEDIQRTSLNLTWMIAFLDEVPAGAAGLLLTDDGASLQSIATAPRFRRRGVASALVRDVVRRGLEAGAPFVSLLTDAGDSPRRLYRKLGFRDVGEVHEFLQVVY